MLGAFTGHHRLMFTDYVDLETGRVLDAEPGGVYDIAPASGRPVPDLPAQWFVAVGDEGSSEDEPETTSEPDTGEG